MFRFVLVVFMFITINVADSRSQEYIDRKFKYEISNLEFNELLLRIKDKRIRKALSIPWLKRYLRQHFRPAIYSIVKHESGNFRWNRGIYDKYDIGYCQISKRYWSIKRINNRFRLSTTLYNWNQFENDISLQIEICSLVWLYNIGRYILLTKTYPDNMLDYIALYHSFKYKNRVVYKKKISKIFWRIEYLFK